MNKKFLGALSLPLLVAACSSEDLMTTPQGENGQYDVAKVDVELALDNQTRLATGWTSDLEAGKDELGFAWLGDGSVITPDGKAYQNHPLYTQNDGNLKPATSIYVGAYYSYYPYNEKVVNVKAIDFTLEGQPFAEGVAGYNGSAKHSIWISPKWTNVTEAGDYPTGDNKAGRGNKITISPRQFTNKALLALNYKNYRIAEGNTAINSISVAYKNVSGEVISAKKFEYAPNISTNVSDWSTSSLAAGVTALTPGVNGLLPVPTQVNGVSCTPGALDLVVAGGAYEIDGTKDYATQNFSFNALPAVEVVDEDTKVEVVMNTTYGVLTISEKISDVAYTHNGTGYAEKTDGTWNDAHTKLLGAVDFDRSFLQVLGVTGKFVLDVDFSKAVMNGMCVTDDAHLQKLLNYYKNNKMNSSDEAVSEAKDGSTDIVLNLNATAGKFELSQTSVALIQQINGTSGEKKVAIQPCSTHGTPAIVLVGGGEVPNLDRVFETSVENVTLAGQTWTWNSTAKKLSDMVSTLTNNGTLNIGSTNVESQFLELINNNKINFTVKTNVQTNLTNNADIAINKTGQMLSYNALIQNFGDIDNDGVIGVVKGTSQEINNYGYIHNDAAAKTYITNNQTVGATFSNAETNENKIGTIELTNWNDNISVSNGTTQGFIKYNWTDEGTYVTPTPAVDVKYNYLIISKNIEFTESEKEILYLEVKSGTGEVIITAETANNVFESPYRLKGFILPEGAVANIKLGNTVKAAAANIKGQLYVGGVFAYDQLTSYLGGTATDTDNIVEY